MPRAGAPARSDPRSLSEMADPRAFITAYASLAQQAASATKVLPSVILAQWCDETEYGTSPAFVSGHNFAGVSQGGYVNGFPDERTGLAAYISTLNQHYYDGVRAAFGAGAQAVALGNSPWAASKYDMTDYKAGKPLNPGVDLLSIINANNLTAYDNGYLIPPGGSSQTGSSGSVLTLPAATNVIPAAGLASNLTVDSILLNGQTLDADISGAVNNCSIDQSMAGASTLTLTMGDPGRVIMNSGLFSQRSTIYIDGLWFELVSVQKLGNELTVTFEAWAVAQLRRQTGAVTIAPGQLTRTDFARRLVQQVPGIGFVQSPKSSDWGTQEALSRGTTDNPLEDTWTCLTRLATEVGWRCFEAGGAIFFGPDQWLLASPVQMALAEFTNGVDTIDGEYDVGQPTSQLTVTCVADNWFAQVGAHVTVGGCGPFNGDWLLFEISKSLFLLDASITLEQAQPSLPEPSSGGSQPAVGTGFSQGGNDQSAAGVAAADQALAYARRQIGVPYQYGGENPATGFDCSGLMQMAYLSAGIKIPRIAQDQFNAGPAVPVGVENLRPGDLVFFGTNPSNIGHVGMYVGNGQMIDAPHAGANVRQESFSPTIGTAWGDNLHIYQGATRPAP